MSDIAIKAQQVSKRYRIGAELRRHEHLSQAMLSWLASPLNNYRRLRSLKKFNDGDDGDVLWALRDVSFEVPEGQVLGIIGANGAGKSTLLRILAGITKPTSGRVDVYGRVASLLEVGTGFHPELTGRENVFLNGTILGMTRQEVADKFDQIVDFSGVERFIDTPVKRYSSGMRVRLAFAVAAHLEPEILLVDEVLAVGDTRFQKKCLGKMSEVARVGRTVFFVSHNLSAVSQLCQRGLVLREGSLVKDGPVSECMEYYLNFSQAAFDGQIEFPIDESQPGQLLSASVLGQNGAPTGSLHYQESPTIRMTMTIREPHPGYNAVVWVFNSMGSCVIASTDRDSGDTGLRQADGEVDVLVPIPPRLLKPGPYSLRVCLNLRRDGSDKPGGDVLSDSADQAFGFEVVDMDSYRSRFGAYGGEMVSPELSWQIKSLP